MATSITVQLDKRRARKDGRFPLVYYLIHNRTNAQISTGTYLLENEWNDEKKLIKTSFKGTESVTRLNNKILKKKTELSDYISTLDEKKELNRIQTARELKELYLKKSSSHFVYGYMQLLIDEMIKAKRIGNARSYETVLGVLKSYLKDKEITFFDLNYSFLISFETNHYAKGNKTNSLAVYMRTIRAVYNRAIKDGLVDRELYPFKNYTIKTTKTRKRAISRESVTKIESLILDVKHPLYHTRNYFLFSFYMRGMPFADMAHLKLSNIIDGRIIFDRQKTDKPYNIKITDSIQALLDIYIIGKEKDDYILSVIKRESIEEQYKDVEWARNRYNKKLKKLAKLCSISENITTYVGRHTFATLAKNLDVPIAVISDMLGHESTKTTEIYMATLPSDLMDNYHEHILDSSKKIKE